MKAVEGWKTCRLGDLVVVQGGFAFKSNDFDDGGIPIIRMSDLDGGHLDLTGSVRIKSNQLKEFSKFALHAGDFLVGMSGSIGNYAIVRKQDLPAYLNQRVGRFRLSNENLADYDFITQIARSNLYKLHVEMLAAGAAQVNISPSQIESFSFDLPPKPEQTKIAEILSTADRAIEQTEALIAKQQCIKTGLMQDLLTRGIDEYGNLRSEQTHKFKDSPLGRIPVEWEVKSLGESAIDLVDGDRGENYPKQDDLLEDAYCLFLSAKNVTKSGFRFSEKQFITEGKDRKLGSGKLKKLDIVLTTRGTIGNFALFNDSVPYENIRVNSGMMILRNCDPELLPEFIFEVLRNFIYEFEYKRVVSGSAQPQLPARDLKAFHIIKPSVEEQKIIISSITRLNETSENQEKHLVKLRSLKTALMQDLLTGKKRVTAMLEKTL